MCQLRYYFFPSSPHAKATLTLGHSHLSPENPALELQVYKYNTTRTVLSTLSEMSTSFGLHAALPLYLHASLSVQLVVIVALSTFLVTALHLSRPDGLHDAESQVASLPCLSVLALVPFFRRRFDFFNWAFAITRQPMFRFKLLNVRLYRWHMVVNRLSKLQNSVYIVSGEENRKAFFSHRSLDLTEGFALLSGAVRYE